MEKYAEPELTVIEADAEDVVRTSDLGDNDTPFIRDQQ